MKRAVVDQAGLRIVIIGIVLSLFIGLIFKSQIRPAVVKNRLQLALVKLQKDVNIDFESVDIRLSEWGIPRPVVEIRGVRISPLKAHCHENQIFIDNLSFPLSFNLLFSENKVISTVRVSLLEIRMKNTRQCFSKDQESDISNTSTSTAIQPVEEVNKIALPKSSPLLEKLRNFKSHLHEIKIDRLRVIATDKLNTAVDFNAVQMLFRYDHEKLNDFLLQGQLLAFKESDKNYYLFKSDMKIALKLETEPNVSAEFKGSVVDRPFQLKIKNNVQKNSLQFLGELNGVSLKAINYIIKAEKPSTEILEFLGGSSLSCYLTGEYFFQNKGYNFDFKDIKVLIGNGVAEVNDIHVFGQADRKAQIRPFDVQLSHIELTKVLSHSAFDNIRPSIQHAGFISGLIQFSDVNQFKVKSLIEDTSFVFSNKGQRVSQTFDSFNFFANIDSEKINLNINDFILDSQKIKGSFKYVQNTQNQDKNVTVDLQGHLLKPDTVKLFTGIAQDIEVKIFLNTDLKNNLKGNVSIDKLSIHQFDLNKVNLDYEKNLLLKREIYSVKTAGMVLKYSNDDKDNQLNMMFDQFLSKPQIMFGPTRVNIQKDGLGKVAVIFKSEPKNRTELNFAGDITSEKNIEIKGNLKTSGKSQNFILSGVFDKLVLTVQ